MNNQKQKIKRPRTLTRIAVVQALFQWEQGIEKTSNLLIEQFLLHRLSHECNNEIYIDGKVYIPNVDLFKLIIQEFIYRNPEIDQIIQTALLQDWPFNRLDPILRAILRAAVTELLLDKQEPPKRVIINEYIDVSHAFSNGDEFILINGILNNLCNRFRIETEDKTK